MYKLSDLQKIVASNFNIRITVLFLFVVSECAWKLLNCLKKRKILKTGFLWTQNRCKLEGWCLKKMFYSAQYLKWIMWSECYNEKISECVLLGLKYGLYSNGLSFIYNYLMIKHDCIKYICKLCISNTIWYFKDLCKKCTYPDTYFEMKNKCSFWVDNACVCIYNFLTDFKLVLLVLVLNLGLDTLKFVIVPLQKHFLG